MTRISQDEMMLRMAEIAALRSTCSRRHVGAVIAREGRALSTGYNGTPAGLPHCWHNEEREHCIQAVHAEANAIAWAARNGIRTEGATMFTTTIPCKKCAELIINAGIARVVYRTGYHTTEGTDLLAAVGIPLEHLGYPYPKEN